MHYYWCTHSPKLSASGQKAGGAIVAFVRPPERWVDSALSCLTRLLFRNNFIKENLKCVDQVELKTVEVRLSLPNRGYRLLNQRSVVLKIRVQHAAVPPGEAGNGV